MLFLFKPKKDFSPISQPKPTQQEKPLIIIETSPKDNQKEVPITSVISITFNKSVPDDIKISTQPTLNFSTQIFDNVFILKPSLLSNNTIYSISVRSKKLLSSYSFFFTTTNKNPEGIGPAFEAIQQIEEEQRRLAPDVFLANKLPHTEQTFSMDFFLNQKTGSNRFAVVTKGDNLDKSKSNAYQWLKSLGLADQQIPTLQISFISEAVMELREKLPYDGTYFTIGYEIESDATTAIIYKNTKAQGDLELDNFLKANSITDQSQIPNFTVAYQ